VQELHEKLAALQTKHENCTCPVHACVARVHRCAQSVTTQLLAASAKASGGVTGHGSGAHGSGYLTVRVNRRSQ
jgi:hypothetical protein